MHKVKDVTLTISIVKESAPNIPLGKSEIVRAVIVCTCKELEWKNGTIIQFNDKAAVVIIQEGNPKGTCVFGPVAQELREIDFT